MSTALLLWTVYLNLQVAPETIGDDRPVYLVCLVESPLRACKAEVLDQWQPCCSMLILVPKCIYEYVTRTTEFIIKMKKGPVKLIKRVKIDHSFLQSS